MKTRLTADEAFSRLRFYIDIFERAGVKISEDQKNYCEEWLFDYVHEMGSCLREDPAEILIFSFDEFAEENR